MGVDRSGRVAREMADIGRVCGVVIGRVLLLRSFYRYRETA